MNLQEQTISKNGVWYGFLNLDEAKGFAIVQGFENTDTDNCVSKL